MVARFHYDDAMLRRLVHDQFPAEEEKKVTAHVEECPTCQSKMESVAEAGISWNDVHQFLDPGSLDKGRLSGCPLASETTGASDEEATVEFLDPSDTPQSLGRFGRYEITEILGRGGMGVVMRGYDPALDRHSTIKVLAPELATNAAARQRFSREAKSAAAVVHGHVIPIQTVDEQRGLPYLVMPVVEGKSLEQRIADDGPLPIIEVLRMGMQVASGLAAAHAQGLVHRDIKPANILLENGVERVMITDFGLARAADDANMTRSGVIAGTPQYMSPEQARGEDVDHRSDLFSLGSVLYFICTGRPPFRAETMMGVLNRIANDQPRSLRKINADVPVWLQAIIDKLQSKDREQRFQSAEEVADLLGQWLAHLQQPDGVPRPSQPPQPLASMGSARFRNRKLVGLAAAGGAILLAAIVIVLQWNKGTITIDCPRPEVGIRIMKGGKLYDTLTVMPGDDSLRVSAGSYLVEIDSEHDGLKVKDGEVTVTRGGTQVVTIVEAASRSPFPKGAHIGRKNHSVRIVHDDVDLHYVSYYAGDFETSSSNSHNTASLTWTDEGSIALKDGTTFSYRRKSADPFHLHVNGKEYDLRQGRVLQLIQGGHVEQVMLFPSLSESRAPYTLARVVASTQAMQKEPFSLATLHRRLAIAQTATTRSRQDPFSDPPASHGDQRAGRDSPTTG